MIAVVLAGSACSNGIRQFAARPVVWHDHDRRTFTPAPRESFSPYFWDAADQMIFRPASEVWTFQTNGESINVNALDEVPDSSWFANRISRRTINPEEMARGACPSIEYEPPGPWLIVAGKTDGATPGFVIEDASGQRHVLKVDRVQQPEQATAADAIVGAIYHAAGYYVPCNRVIGFTRDMLTIERGAMVERADAAVVPMTRQHVDAVLRVARRWPDRRYRAVVSRYIDGRPLGPWSYRGTRADDPNDVVPHEYRRELRGMFVLSAWVNHWDSRDNNTLSSWIERPHGGYVRHYVIDFGESLGMLESNDRAARRFGHSQWLDVQHIVEDMAGLGFVERPWDSGELGPAGHVLGYFDVERFEPDQWRPDYWNGAFERLTERDAAWMARIIARFDRRQIRALASLGHYTEPLVERELVRVLAGRRRVILERYLTRLSPLADPELVGSSEVCVTDLAVRSRLRWAQDRRYQARAYAGPHAAPLGRLAIRRDGDRICVALPPARDYLVVDVAARTARAERNFPARLHFAAGPHRALRLVGLERPASHAPPS
jgi:hypothetical protein